MKRSVLALSLLVLLALGGAGRSALARRARGTEANKALVRQFFEDVFNKADIGAVDKYIAPDAVDHNPLPGQAPGLPGIRDFFTTLHTAFPDTHVSIDDVIAEGDKVVVRSTLSGTQKGTLMGIPATGRHVTVTGIDIVRIRDGKMVEHWGNADDLGMMQQLGVIPAPKAPGSSP